MPLLPFASFKAITISNDLDIINACTITLPKEAADLRLADGSLVPAGGESPAQMEFSTWNAAHRNGPRKEHYPGQIVLTGLYWQRFRK